MPKVNRLLAAVIVLSTVSAACSGTDGTATTSPAEPRSIADLDAALRPAAQKLLDAVDMDASTVYFEHDAAEVPYRYDWMAIDGSGDSITVSNDIAQGAIVAFIQSGDDRYTASEIGNKVEPWRRLGPALPPPEGTLPLLLVTELANGSAMTVDDGRDQTVITQQQASDGAEVWRLAGSSDAGAATALLAEWIIDSEGTLWFFRSESETEPSPGLPQTVITRFSIPEEAVRIAPPAEGTRLELQQLGVPEDLLALDE